MTNRQSPCPGCKFPLLLVPGVAAGVCPECRKPFTLKAGVAAADTGAAWPACEGAEYIGSTHYFRGKNYTFFAAVTWRDLTYDCTSTELFLINDAQDEVSLEYEEDDDGNVVWWLSEDATDDVVKQPDGSVQYKGKTYQPYGKAALGYQVVTQAGAMDVPYDKDEGKSVRWYTDFKGDLGRRAGRLGYTRELGQDTWFWMAPASAPLRRSSPVFDSARRAAWSRRNNLTLMGTLAAIALAVVLYVVGSASAAHRVSYDSGTLTSPAQRHWVSDAFELGGRRSNVQARVRVQGLANWFDTTLCLANLETQRRYCILVEVDRDQTQYAGGYENEELFSSVPSGRYVLEGQAESDVNAPVRFEVQLVRDARRTGTLWLALAVLLGGPVLVLVFQLARDQMRTKSAGEAFQVVLVMGVMLFIIFLDWMD